MMTSYSKLTIATLLVAFFCVSAVLADEALIRQFLQEAPRKWLEYESLLRGFEVVGENALEFLPPGSKGKGEKQSQFESDRVVVDASATSAFMERGPEVCASNPDYWFTLRQNAMIYLYPVRSSDSPVSAATSVGMSRVGTIWHLYPLDLRDIISSPNFKVTSATEIEHEGESAVQIDFQWDREANKKGRYQKGSYPFDAHKGSVLLCPKRYWAVLGGTLTVDDPKKQLGSYELKNRLGGFGSFPVVVESDFRSYDPDHNWQDTMISKYSWKKFEGNENIFRLSGYGFPEIRLDTTAKENSWNLLFIVAAGFLCGLLVGRWWRVSRRTLSAQP